MRTCNIATYPAILKMAGFFILEAVAYAPLTDDALKRQVP